MDNTQPPNRPLSMAAVKRIWAARRAGLPTPDGPSNRAPRVTAEAQPREHRGKQFDSEQRPGKPGPKPSDIDKPLVHPRYLTRNDSADDRIAFWSPEPLHRHLMYVEAVSRARQRGDSVRQLSRIGCFTANPMLTVAFIRRAADAFGVAPEGFMEFAEQYAGMAE